MVIADKIEFQEKVIKDKKGSLRTKRIIIIIEGNSKIYIAMLNYFGSYFNFSYIIVYYINI